MRPTKAVAIWLAALVALSGCSFLDSKDPAATTTLRLGYFPNLTHAPALVGIGDGEFESKLQSIGLTLTPVAFNAGPDAVSALFGESLDCAFVGPNPTLNAYAQSQGLAIKVVAGTTSGGAALVVGPTITSVADLAGKTLATPQLGNTQDVALRYWLKGQGFEVTTEGGGDVAIRPQSNAEGLAAFISGNIDGAWVPEPWVSEYLAAGAKILVDEAELWPEGKFVTTQLVCRTKFLNENPSAVSALVDGLVTTLTKMESDPAGTKTSFTNALSALTGTAIKPEILDRAWSQLSFTYDPIATSLSASAQHAISVGLLNVKQIEQAGGLPGELYDLTILNAILKAQGKGAVSVE